MKEKRYRTIYEDDALIIVDKPSGMLVIPTPRRETDTLTALLNRALDERGITVNAYPCHRLDRETSGIIIYAKGKSIQQRMMDEFKKRNVTKAYIAFVHGNVKKDQDTIDDMVYNRNRRRKEPALTRYTVVARKGGYTVVTAEPVTGRTNQIRVHFAGIGHPLVGEDIYAFRRDFALRFKRVALHAARIRFLHPVTKAAMDLEAPLPEDMERFLKKEEHR